MNSSDKIRTHLAAYPIGHRFTTEQVRRELRMATMQGKQHVFNRMTNDGWLKKVRMERNHWLYDKIAEFTLDDLKPVRKSKDCKQVKTVTELDAFIFGGCRERVVCNMNKWIIFN